MREREFYEQASIWEASRYSGNFEEERMRACVDTLPQDLESMLDAGAGNGAFLRMVEQRGGIPTLAGVDRSTAAIAARLSHAPVTQAQLHDLPFDDGAFDLLSALDVVEHLPHGVYERAMEEFQRVAARYILVNVPYREHRLHVVCPYCDCRFNPHFHMRSFDLGTLAGLFPAFRMVRRTPIYREESLLAVAVRPFRRQVYGGFPDTAICPQCGYRAAPRAAQGASSHKGTGVHRLANMFPTLRVEAEMAVLYERIVA